MTFLRREQKTVGQKTEIKTEKICHSTNRLIRTFFFNFVISADFSNIIRPSPRHRVQQTVGRNNRFPRYFSFATRFYVVFANLSSAVVYEASTVHCTLYMDILQRWHNGAPPYGMSCHIVNNGLHSPGVFFIFTIAWILFLIW